MVNYLLRRLIYIIFTVCLVSIVSFIIIQLPPGDYLTFYMGKQAARGAYVSREEIASLSRQYGLDKPLHVQYIKWVWNIISRGDFGRSFQFRMPVKELIWQRISFTMIMGIAVLVFIHVVAIPIGIYSALHKYSFWDFFFTTVGYAGLATPNFLLALILMYIGLKYFGMSVGGLFSPEYLEAPWSFGKVVDMLSHLWIPIIVLGTAGTAEIIRVMRGMLLDELQKQYVITAKAKGLKNSRLIFKYPVRIALNPIISTIGWRLTIIISGAPIVAIVLSLPTTGPLLLRSLVSQDMYLAGAFFLLLCTVTVIGTFISDILLALIDPRIRMEG